MAKRKAKLPKRIAGIKIRKNVRNGAARFVTGPLAREIFAAALVAGAAALANNKQVKKAARGAGDDIANAASESADKASRLVDALAAALRGAAHRIHPESEGVDRKQKAKHNRKSNGKGKLHGRAIPA